MLWLVICVLPPALVLRLFEMVISVIHDSWCMGEQRLKKRTDELIGGYATRLQMQITVFDWNRQYSIRILYCCSIHLSRSLSWYTNISILTPRTSLSALILVPAFHNSYLWRYIASLSLRACTCFCICTGFCTCLRKRRKERKKEREREASKCVSEKKIQQLCLGEEDVEG